MGQERLGPSYFFISLVLGPLNSLLSYVPSSRYIWSSAPILFLQEQTKDIIIYLGLKSIVSFEYVSILKALKAVSKMQAGQVGASKRSPSLPLRCRQCRTRGRDLAPDMQVLQGPGHWHLGNFQS